MPSHAAPGTGLDGANIAATLATLMISTPAEPRLQIPISWPSPLTIGAPSGVDGGQPSSVMRPSGPAITLAAVGVAPRTVTESPADAAGPIPYDVVTAAASADSTASPRSRSTISTAAACGLPLPSLSVMDGRPSTARAVVMTSEPPTPTATGGTSTSSAEAVAAVV